MAGRGDGGVDRLMANFGRNLDREVLESVLEICGGDVAAAVAFLQSQGAGDYVEEAGAANEDRLPPHYLDRPPGYDASRLRALLPEPTPATQLKRMLTGEARPFSEHMKAQREQTELYTAVLLVLLRNGVAMSSPTRSYVLAAAWARSDIVLVDYLLAQKDVCGLPEVLRALKLLDAPRRLRALKRRLRKLQEAKAKVRTLTATRAAKHEILAEIEEGQVSSVSGAMCKRVRRWVGEVFTAAELVFFALQLPTEPWRELSDIVHCRPTDFAQEWFLPFVYGTPAPIGSSVHEVRGMTMATVEAVVQTHEVPYAYLRSKLPRVPDSVKSRVAEYETMDIVLWYYEELAGAPHVNETIARRLSNGEEPTFNYGKLLERLLMFKLLRSPGADLVLPHLIPIAERRLQEIKLPLSSQHKAVVLGDASYSMDCAIRVSTVIGSLLAALASAELRFFNVRTVRPPGGGIPRTVEQVLDVATATKADGLTAPACTVLECLRSREKVGCFIVVTDEIENEPSEGQFFAQVLYQYLTEVYPSTVVFVSFLDKPGKGRMVRSLENLGITPLQFRLDAGRPDLTKVGPLLGVLSTETSAFPVLAEELAASLEEHGLRAIIERPEQFMARSLNDTVAEAAAVAPQAEVEEVADQLRSSSLAKSGKRGEDCEICMAMPADTALIECGHLVCNVCAKSLMAREERECPFCRQPVQGVLRVFRP